MARHRSNRNAATVAERFAVNLICAREDAGLTQEEVGVRAELHRTEISELERGLRVPRMDTLLKLGGAIGVEPDALMRGIRWTPASITEGGFQPRADRPG